MCEFWQLWSASPHWQLFFAWPHGFFLHMNSLVFSQSFKGIPMQIWVLFLKNISTLLPYKYWQPLPQTPIFVFLTQHYYHAVLRLPWVPYLYHSLQSTWRQIARAMFHLFTFFQISQPCTACCPIPENSYFTYFVWYSKCLWSRINLVPIIATWPAESTSSLFLKDIFCWVLNYILTVSFTFGILKVILLSSGLHCFYEKAAIILIIFPLNVFLFYSCFKIFLYI